MQFVKRILEVKKELEKLGHKPYLTNLYWSFEGAKSDDEREKIKLDNKFNKDAIRVFWRAMQGGEAILVLNYNKKGIKNYIGGNTLMEIGFAHVLGQKIFLLNPIPEIDFYKTEIQAVRPTILNGDLAKIK